MRVHIKLLMLINKLTRLNSAGILPPLYRHTRADHHSYEDLD